MSKYFPRNDYVMVKRVSAANKIGGILLPESSQPKNRGEVVAVGPGRYENGAFVPMGLNVGDQVVFNRALDFENDMLLIKENEILCVVT